MSRAAKPFNENNIVSIQLAAHNAPLIEEEKNAEYPYVLFSTDSTGKDKYKWRNQYPQYLIYLLNRSAKHNAIVTAKAQYIAGKGFELNNDLTDPEVIQRLTNVLAHVNGLESADAVLQKLAFDLELFNGFAIEIVQNKSGKGAPQLYHTDFSRWRSDKAGETFYYTSDWKSYHPDQNDDWRILPAYDPTKPAPKSLLYYKGYRPSLDVYPFPEYLGAIAYIECDYEIANFHLNNLKNGFVAGTIVSLNNGVPTDEEQKTIEAKIKKKFAGTDNAGQLIISFADNKDKAPTIENLTPSDMDKQFNLLNQTVQQEIFTAHRVTSPILFGVKTEGQLGNRQEFADAWELFQNNYISVKQKILEEVFNDLLENVGFPRGLHIAKLSPIGIGIDDTTIASVMTLDEIRAKAGLPKLQQGDITIGQITKGAPADISAPIIGNGAPAAQPVQNAINESILAVNEHVKNLTAKQHQELIRIIRQFTKGQLTMQAAKTMLKLSLGLNDEDILALLGIDEEQQLQQFRATKELTESDVINAFQKFGQPKKGFTQLISKSIHQRFDATDLSALQKDVLRILKGSPDATNEDIASALKVDVKSVNSAVNDLVKAEVIKNNNGRSSVIPAVNDAIGNSVLSIMYDYALRPGVGGAVLLPTSRPFCVQMIEMDKYYTQSDIEQISQQLGYDVFDFAGGWWNHGDGTITPYCRHEWRQNLVKKNNNG